MPLASYGPYCTGPEAVLNWCHFRGFCIAREIVYHGIIFILHWPTFYCLICTLCLHEFREFIVYLCFFLSIIWNFYSDFRTVVFLVNYVFCAIAPISGQGLNKGLITQKMKIQWNSPLAENPAHKVFRRTRPRTVFKIKKFHTSDLMYERVQ